MVMWGQRGQRFAAALAFLLVAAAVIANPVGTPQARAATLNVGIAGCDDVAGAPYCTISAALDNASSGDTIVIDSGTYVENVSVGVDVTIVGAGTTDTIIDGDSAGRVLEVTSEVAVEITDLSIVSGLSPDEPGSPRGGGGILNDGFLDLERVRIAANDTLGTSTDVVGGGIHNRGTLSIVQSTIEDNGAYYRGGGIAQTAGSLSMLDSTVANNTGGPSFGGGGGISLTGGTGADLSNVTVSGNDTGGSLGGGGVDVGIANVIINSSTISGNTDNGGGNGGGGIIVSGSLEISNTIIAGNSSVGLRNDCSDNLGGTITTLGHNLIGRAGGGGECDQFQDGVNGDIVGVGEDPVDPLLDALADNGGPTATMLPQSGSPAIDAGSLETPGTVDGSCTAVDQRGVDRPVGDACDVGAVEVDTTLQALIDAAAPGETINAPAGAFVENISIGDGKHLIGAGIGSTVIDGDDYGTTVEIESGGATLEALTIQNGAGLETSGGNIRNDGQSLTLIGVDVVGGGADVNGGNIYSTGTVVLTDSTIRDGSAETGGGGLYSAGDYTIVGTTFEGNSATNGGAILGVDAASIEDSQFVGNSADFGGAILDDGELSVSGSTFTDNGATEAGGAILTGGLLYIATSTFAGNSASVGGAVVGGSGEVHVDSSTFTDNTASASALAAGAALLMEGGGSVVNSTISGNAALNGGGAIAVDGSSVEINNSTLVFNAAGSDAGGVVSSGFANVTLSNSIIAGNTVDALPADCVDTFSRGHNIFGDDGCFPKISDQTNVADPLLGPLQDNGGETQTHALLPGSPALDAGDPGTPFVELFDWLGAELIFFNGSAVEEEGGLLLSDGFFEAGSVWAAPGEGPQIRFDTSFVSEFSFIIDPIDDGGIVGELSGDGLTFAASRNASLLGEAGGRLGIAEAGGNESLAVEFDTFTNSTDPISTSHIGVNEGGQSNGDGAISEVTETISGDFDDGQEWTAWVEYNAYSETLDVSVAHAVDAKPASPQLSHVVDIAELLDDTGVLGFTSAGGQAFAEHRITGWEHITFSCEGIDQRGITRPQGSACDIGSFESEVELAISLSLDNDALIDAGASTIATTDLPATLATSPSDPNDSTDDNIASAPIANLDTQTVESAPIANLPIANLPIANLDAFAAAVTDDILLANLPITGGWETHLAASDNLKDRPIQSVTLFEAIEDDDVVASLSLPGTAELELNDLNVASTPIANLTIAGLALGSLPIANLPLDTDRTQPAEVLADWCVLLEDQQVTCADLGIDPTTGDDNDYSVAGLSIAGADISAAPIANLPIANLPIANLPIANLPVANLTVVGAPIANLPIANLPIANLDPTGAPIANLPIANLPIANLPIANLPIANLPIANLPIANLTVNGAPIANLPIANLTTTDGEPVAVLGVDGLPIANLPIANLPIANLPIANLADFVDCDGEFDCAAPGATVADAFLAGALRGDVTQWLAFLSIKDLLDIGAEQNGQVMTEVDFDALFAGLTLLDLVPDGEQFANLGQIPLLELQEDLAGMIWAELLQAMQDGGLGEEFTLGDLLLMLVNPSEYPWEDLDLTKTDLQTFDATGGNTEFTAELNVTGGGGIGGELDFTLPSGFLFTGVDVTHPSGNEVNYTFAVDGQSVDVDIASLRDGVTTVAVSAAASLSLGIGAAEVTASVGGLDAAAATTIQVAEVLEPNDTPEQAQPVTNDTLYLTHIATEGDIDMYRLDGVETGDRVSVVLSDMTEDFDLVLYRPELPPLRPGGVVPEGIAPGVSDPGGFVDGDDQIQNELTGDFPHAIDANGERLAIYETSTQQGTSDEIITTATLQAPGTYYVQVHGNNGVTSLDPYALRADRIERATGLACELAAIPPGTPAVNGPVFVADAAEHNALFLFNEKRLRDIHGADAASDIRAALEGLASQGALGVNGIVVPVDSDPAVAAAYEEWESGNNRCDPHSANNVAAHIGALVDQYRADHPLIEFVTVVGDDLQIPFFRVPDYTEIANESEYATSVATTGNELTSSLFAGFVLTDDPYGDANPLDIGGRHLYISEVAMGRLVETPEEILGTIGRFTQFDGELDADTAQSHGLVTGYDFIEDAAIGIAGALELDNRRAAGSTALLNTDGTANAWTSGELSGAIDNEAADLIGLGAHMSHDSLLSAAEDLTNSQADLYTTGDAANQSPGIFDGSVIFSMGCHSGLPVPDFALGSATPDWAQQLAGDGAVYVAETGYGYGDTEFLAYGEELMRQFAGRLNGERAVGSAMQLAKQFHAANLSVYSPYDEKVIMETVVYGLPFFTVGTPQSGPPPPPVLPSSVDPITGLTIVSTSFDFDTAPLAGDGLPNTGTFELQTGDRGSFYTGAAEQGDLGEAQVTAFHPIQPKALIDVTQDGLVGTGVLVEALTSEDIDDFNPVFSRPTVDLSDKEPEQEFPGTYPLVLPGINAYVADDGQRDQLVMVLGQFTDTGFDDSGLIGTERLFTHIDATVYYGDPADQIQPTILSVEAIDTDGVLSFTVDAYDLDALTQVPVERVLVLYKPDGVDGDWTPLDLALVDGRWSGGAPSLGVKVEYVVQAVDSNGLVSVHSNKTAGNESMEAPAPVPGGIDIEINGGVAEPVYTADPVTVELVGLGDNPTVLVDVDGAGFEPYTGPFEVTGEGVHTITVDDGTGVVDSATFIIDTSGPAIIITSPVDGEIYEPGGELTAEFTCTDAGVGATSCDGALDGTAIQPGATIDATTPGTFTLTVVSTDGVGNASESSVTFEVLPLAGNTAPEITSFEGPLSPLPFNIEAFASATFIDPDVDDMFTVMLDWGDGSVTQPTPVAVDGVYEINDSHFYGAPGVYTLTLTVTDAAGDSDSETFLYAVMFDPTGRKIVGSVRVVDGADQQHLGVNVKPDKKTLIPNGFVRYNFDGSGFADGFDATTLDFLYVFGGWGAVGGTGTIDGAGDYEFVLSAVDIGPPGSGDAFRIKIWTAGDPDDVVIDTQPGDADLAFPTTEPTSGNIVVR